VGTFGHGFTYSGHPVCAAVALRNLELMEEREVFAHAAVVGEELQQRLAALADHPLVGEVRGVGLIAALELVADKETKNPFPADKGVGAMVSARCEAHGLIIRALGDNIAICPPLVISSAQVDELVSKLERSLDETLSRVR
jgi:4-aminobutyrate--pyruvate transaminase